MRTTIKKIKTNLFKNEDGVTLIELAFILVVVGLIVVAVLPFFKTNVRSYMAVTMTKDAVQSGRIGFNRMMNELKRLESSLDIDFGYTDQIQFDLPHQSDINYTFENLQLTREGEALIEDVQTFEFKFYREDGTERICPFISVSDVWRIEVTMAVGDGVDNVEFRGQVSPRNIHFN